MSNQHDPFPVDAATLDIIEAAVVNEGAEHSGLYSMLSFLSGNLDHDHDTAGCERVEPNVWVCNMHPEHTPQEVILALIAEVRRLRGTAQPDRDGHGYPLDPNDPDYPPSAIAALTALNLASHRFISAGREGRIAVHTNEDAARRAVAWARTPEGARALFPELAEAVDAMRFQTGASQMEEFVDCAFIAARVFTLPDQPDQENPASELGGGGRP
jgi:hypothetical protein